jgi:hypothetical protein
MGTVVYTHTEQLDVFPGNSTELSFSPTNGIGKTFSTFLVTISNTFAANVQGKTTSETFIPVSTAITSGATTCRSNTINIGLGTRTTVVFQISCAANNPIVVQNPMTITLFDQGNDLNWCNGQSTQSMTIEGIE